MINVSKPFLPPAHEYQSLLDDIWKRCWLTNNGPFVNELELRLKDFLNIDHLLFLANGTIALQIAFKALDLKGEVITTPFSYVATTSSLVWERLTPIFVDIDPFSFNIDPDLIEKAITPNTTAILATHVFGNPCDIERLQILADKYHLKLIFDAAHAFAVNYRGHSIFDYGDISTASFHATKLFHTIEGGAVITKDPELTSKMAKLRNFGHDGPAKFTGVGINGKNSEFHAAMGLTNLKHMDKILEKRKAQYLFYKEKLKNLHVQFQEINEDCDYNYAYFPIVFPSEKELLQALKELNQHYIHPRRYFYPSLNTLDYVNNKTCPYAEDISRRILCLPIYHELSESSIEMICRILIRTERYYKKPKFVKRATAITK
ncbi:MAG TPA: DegT/DnrJ/EryC1/StrS family aminotransferase [Saprospiraceae bacterium]|nr:DegT/DnrJ/EryC1/StrS family aminotransferase [Saprospiraceae bacterium]